MLFSLYRGLAALLLAPDGQQIPVTTIQNVLHLQRASATPGSKQFLTVGEELAVVQRLQQHLNHVRAGYDTIYGQGGTDGFGALDACQSTWDLKTFQANLRRGVEQIVKTVLRSSLNYINLPQMGEPLQLDNASRTPSMYMVQSDTINRMTQVLEDAYFTIVNELSKSETLPPGASKAMHAPPARFPTGPPANMDRPGPRGVPAFSDVYPLRTDSDASHFLSSPNESGASQNDAVQRTMMLTEALKPNKVLTRVDSKSGLRWTKTISRRKSKKTLKRSISNPYLVTTTQNLDNAIDLGNLPSNHVPYENTVPNRLRSLSSSTQAAPDRSESLSASQLNDPAYLRIPGYLRSPSHEHNRYDEGLYLGRNAAAGGSSPLLPGHTSQNSRYNALTAPETAARTPDEAIGARSQLPGPSIPASSSAIPAYTALAPPICATDYLGHTTKSSAPVPAVSTAKTSTSSPASPLAPSTETSTSPSLSLAPMASPRIHTASPPRVTAPIVTSFPDIDSRTKPLPDIKSKPQNVSPLSMPETSPKTPPMFASRGTSDVKARPASKISVLATPTGSLAPNMIHTPSSHTRDSVHSAMFTAEGPEDDSVASEFGHMSLSSKVVPAQTAAPPSSTSRMSTVSTYLRNPGNSDVITFPSAAEDSTEMDFSMPGQFFDAAPPPVPPVPEEHALPRTTPSKSHTESVYDMYATDVHDNDDTGDESRQKANSDNFKNEVYMGQRPVTGYGFPDAKSRIRSTRIGSTSNPIWQVVAGLNDRSSLLSEVDTSVNNKRTSDVSVVSRLPESSFMLSQSKAAPRFSTNLDKRALFMQARSAKLEDHPLETLLGPSTSEKLASRLNEDEVTLSSVGDHENHPHDEDDHLVTPLPEPVQEPEPPVNGEAQPVIELNDQGLPVQIVYYDDDELPDIMDRIASGNNAARIEFRRRSAHPGQPKESTDTKLKDDDESNLTRVEQSILTLLRPTFSIHNL